MSYHILKETHGLFTDTGEVSDLPFPDINDYITQLQAENGGCYAAQYFEPAAPAPEAPEPEAAQ